MAETYRGSCYCGTVRWEATGKPFLSAYCHCTLCQRLAGSPFIHTIHFLVNAFKWTHEEPVYGFLDCYPTVDKPWKKRWRCKNCGACVASYHERNERWSLWGSQLERDGGKIKDWDALKPTAHMFYGTRMLDVNDGLPKWAEYPDRSERLG